MKLYTKPQFIKQLVTVIKRYTFFQQNPQITTRILYTSTKTLMTTNAKAIRSMEFFTLSTII